MKESLYKNFFYTIEYISQIDPFGPKMWNANKDMEKLKGDILESNWIQYSLKGMHNKI